MQAEKDDQQRVRQRPERAGGEACKTGEPSLGALHALQAHLDCPLPPAPASMRPRLIAAENSLPASRYLKRISEVIHERCLSSATWEAADEPSTRLIKLANP